MIGRKARSGMGDYAEEMKAATEYYSYDFSGLLEFDRRPLSHGQAVPALPEGEPSLHRNTGDGSVCLRYWFS